MTCARGTRDGAKMQRRDGEKREDSVCTIAGSNRSISRHFRSFMNTKQSTAIPVICGVFPLFFFFFLTMCLVSLKSKKVRKKNELYERKTIMAQFLTSCSAAQCKKATRILPHKVSNLKIREKFRELFLHSEDKIFSRVLPHFCFLLEKFSNVCYIYIYTYMVFISAVFDEK